MRRLRTQQLLDLEDKRKEKERKKDWLGVRNTRGKRETRSTTSTRNVHYVRECKLSHVDVLGEGLYGEGLRFVVVKRSDEDDNGDEKRIDWVDNYIAIREKRDGQ
ncbi:hypothetical protein Tco_0959745 [Tanacetum coccineum]